MTRGSLVLALLLVACGDARPVEGTRWNGKIHAAGILDPASGDFHGNLLAQNGWDFDFCRKCHGDDFSGGKSGVSCLTCHADGPTACTTCHGQPPSTGAHVAHAKSPTLDKPVACETCHPVPTEFRAHIDGTVAVTIAGWDGATCSDVGCHSNVTTPSWRDGHLQCGGCHTLPPSTHPESRCVSCHPKVVDASQMLVDKQRHIDGKISIGDESGDACTACHRVLPGAHTAHLAASHKLSKPIDCAACHPVPSSVLAPKHGDGVVQLGDCAKCHGTTPMWTDPPVYCGSCHGVPPGDSRHAGATLANCYTCHPSTMTAMGTLLPDAHINGVVDAQ